MAPTEEQIEELLLSCRYGELEEVKAFVEEFGWESVKSARDDRGNTALHMCCGNGHTDVLKYVLPQMSKELLEATNENGSPAIHWAILNNHVDCVKALVETPEEQGGGLSILKQTNRAGRDAFAESIFAGEGKEEVSGWIEGYLWKIEGGDDEEEAPSGANDAEAEIKMESGDEVTKDEGETVDGLVEKTKDAQI